MRNQPVPEIIDPVFAKTSQNARFLLSENERFGLVFVKTGSINSGTGGVHGHCDKGGGRGKAVDIFYLDFATAFDKVSRQRLLKKMRAKVIHAGIIKWIEDWLSGRIHIHTQGAVFEKINHPDLGGQKIYGSSKLATLNST